MAKVTFEQAYETKQAADAARDAAQAKLNDIVSQQSEASRDLTDRTDAASRAESTLDQVAAQIPGDTAVQTADGSLLFVIAGVIHKIKTVGADTVSLDDGTPAPSPEPAPAPQPAPAPAPEPAPEQLPLPDVNRDAPGGDAAATS